MSRIRNGPCFHEPLYQLLLPPSRQCNAKFSINLDETVTVRSTWNRHRAASFSTPVNTYRGEHRGSVLQKSSCNSCTVLAIYAHVKIHLLIHCIEKPIYVSQNRNCTDSETNFHIPHSCSVSDFYIPSIGPQERGYDVIRVCTPGWRPTKAAVQEILPKIANAKTLLSEDDIVILHCLDKSSYFSRTEDGGDIPIRRCDDGDFHVEGELVLAPKDRQLALFNTIEPILTLLALYKFLLVTPMPRFLYEGCCPLGSHAPNRLEDGFEERLRVGLRDYRINIKNFCFMRNMRNIKVLDPSPPVLTHSEEDGEEIWGVDPVHPFLHWYRLLCDMYENEMSQLLGKTRKRSGGSLQPPPERTRIEPRPSWIEVPKLNAVRRGGRNDRGKIGVPLNDIVMYIYKIFFQKP
jgi:hypothetical protein